MTGIRRMSFDDQHDCWTIELNDRRYPLHCGECFELILGTSKVPCRLELDEEWYLIMEEIRLNLRERDTYRIRL